MDYAYYIGEGLENDEIMEQVQAKLNILRDARNALIAKYGAERMMVKGKHVYGLAWKAEQPERWKHLLCERGGYYVYDADRRYRQGKDFHCDLMDDSVVDKTDGWLKKKLGVDHMACGVKAVYWTCVGWNNGHLLVKIPDDGSSHNPAPKPPAWFREVTLKEWRELCKASCKTGTVVKYE